MRALFFLAFVAHAHLRDAADVSAKVKEPNAAHHGLGLLHHEADEMHERGLGLLLHEVGTTGAASPEPASGWASSCAIGSEEMKRVTRKTDSALGKMFDWLTGLLVGYPADPGTNVHPGSPTKHRTKAGSRKGPANDTTYFQHTGWAKTEASRVNACLRCLLTDTTKLLTENKIRYVITGGTLLGATRTGRAIDWDDDLDFRVHPDDWKVFRSVMAKAAEEQGVGNASAVRYNEISFDSRQGKVPDIQAACMNPTCNCGSSAECPHADVVDASYRCCSDKDDVWPDVTSLFDDDLRKCKFATADGLAVEVSAPSVQATLTYLERVFGTWTEPK